MKLSDIDLTNIINDFSAYNNARMQYIVNRDIKVFDNLPESSVRGLLSISALMMDLYTLARMFRTYPVEHRTKDKSNTPHHPAHYIIEYAGLAHIAVMTEYFHQMGANIVIYDATPNNKRCVTVPNDFFDL